MQITYRDRTKAKAIVHTVRNQYNRTDAAHILGIDINSISWIEHMHKRSDNSDLYQAPKESILKVLEWGRLNAKFY